MGERTGIGWTNFTFNPWWGCTKVSPGCDVCYAERDSKRFGHDVWGAGKPRRYFGDKHWAQPLKWNQLAKESGKRSKVFCASMADVFDNEVDQSYRERLWKLIEDTPYLDWQLLTKRIGNARAMLPARWFENGFPENVWLGITVVNQEEADRDIPKLLAIPARLHWLSIEPMLGLTHLMSIPVPQHIIDDSSVAEPGGTYRFNALTDKDDDHFFNVHQKIDWVVVGGESGVRPRPFEIPWLELIVDDTRAAGVPLYVKQDSGNKPGQQGRIPDELWIQEFPA